MRHVTVAKVDVPDIEYSVVPAALAEPAIAVTVACLNLFSTRRYSRCWINGTRAAIGLSHSQLGMIVDIYRRLGL